MKCCEHLTLFKVVKHSTSRQNSNLSASLVGQPLCYQVQRQEEVL